MKRFFLLWLILFVAGFAIAEPLRFLLRHEVDVRFDAVLTLLLAPAVQAILLFTFVPSLRDRRFEAPGNALMVARLLTVAGLLLVILCTTTALAVVRILPLDAFDVVRGAFAVIAAGGFVRAATQGVKGAIGAAILFAILGVTSGHVAAIGERVFPTQPLAFRWLVFFGVTTLVLLAAILLLVDRLRSDTPHAATLLEWSLVPATVAGLIVLANFYQRPFIPATHALVANVLGLAAMGFAMLAGLAGARRS
jgi:hypothetical protein